MDQVYVERDLDKYKLTEEQAKYLRSSDGWVGIAGRIIEEESRNLIGVGRVTGLRLDVSTPVLDSLVLSLETRVGINLEATLHILKGSLQAFEIHTKYLAVEERFFYNFRDDVKPSLECDYKTKEKEVDDTLRVGIPSAVTSSFYEMMNKIGTWRIVNICPSWSGQEDWVTLYNKGREQRFVIRMDPGGLHGIEIGTRNHEGVIFYFEEKSKVQLDKLPRERVRDENYHFWGGALIPDLEMKDD